MSRKPRKSTRPGVRGGVTKSRLKHTAAQETGRLSGRNGRIRYSPFQKTVLMALAIGLGIAFIPSINTGISQAQKIAALEHDNQVTQREIDDLATKQENLKDDAYIERVAREKFSYVKDGEEAYIVVSEEETGTATHQANKGQREQPWYTELIDSLKVVGTATEE